MKAQTRELTQEERSFITEQNYWCRRHLPEQLQPIFDIASGKIALIQRILDENVYQKTETAAFEALGICLGEVLAERIGLHWVVFTDDKGTDLALQYKDTSITLFPMTMISRRIERGEVMDVADFVEQTEKTINDMAASGTFV